MIYWKVLNFFISFSGVCFYDWMRCIILYYSYIM